MALCLGPARWALLLLVGALAIASAQERACCYNGGGGCGECRNGYARVDEWCGQSEDQCRQCSGEFCLGKPAGGFVDESAPKSGMCCFYSPDGDMCGHCTSMATGTEWCAQDEGRCTGCGGSFCAAGQGQGVPPPVRPSPPNNGGGQVPPPVTPGPIVPPPGNNVPPPPGNPFFGKPMYINPSFSENIATSIATAAPGLERDNLEVMAGVPSAYWLDTMAKVVPTDDAGTLTAAGILRDASAQSPPPLVTLIVYDLPNRDCHAKASNGEICCGGVTPEGPCDYLDAASTGTCDEGLEMYRRNYIDQLAVTVSQYCGIVPMALVIEPDSLPNLATNRDDPKCGSRATETAYKEGIAYAIKTLNLACPEAVQYLDGAHGGWLGWENNAAAFAKDVASLGVAHLLRGFSQNVANIQELGLTCPQVGWCVGGKNQGDPCCYDPCGISAEYNPGHNELNYAMVLHDAMVKAIPGWEPHMIIDTGRNARSPRTDCGNWCNARGAGTGVLPTTSTAIPEIIDAYLWLKTPGESDGCTEVLPTGEFCPRFDLFCGSVDSIGSRPGEPRAPEAGDWFDYQVKMLARNAKFQ